jgi:hypothetical protein
VGTGVKRRRDLRPEVGHDADRHGAARAEGELAEQVPGGRPGARARGADRAPLPSPGCPGARVKEEKRMPAEERVPNGCRVDEPEEVYRPVWMRPPSWLYLPHLGWGGRTEQR